MRQVIFSKNIKEVEITGLPEDTLIVYHEMYDIPKIKGRIIEWKKFKANYPEYETSQFVIVGANRMITPSNRCDMVNDYLQVMTKTIPKISIDTSPFVGEPWRLWYHYSLAFGEWLGTDYSYPIEGDWKNWFYYDSNFSKLSADNLPIYIKNTHSDLERLKTKFEFYDLEDLHLDFYETAKKEVFNRYDTPKMLTNNLLKLLNKHFGLDVGMGSYLTNRTYLLPDVGVYRYVAEENKRRMAIYNLFTK